MYHGSAIDNSSGMVKISGSASFVSNSITAKGSGGAIFQSGGTVTISHATFSNNHAPNGGGIYVHGATLNIAATVFASNTANDGGAIYAASAVESGIVLRPNNTIFNAKVSITAGCLFTSNTATDEGGAIYEDSHATVTATDSGFVNNKVLGTGGGLQGRRLAHRRLQHALCQQGRLRRRRNLRLRRQRGLAISESCSLTSNSVTRSGSGGGIDVVSDAAVTINNSLLTFNSAEYGGAVSVFGGSLTIELSYFHGNTASDYGGAVAATTANVVIKSGCSFSGNSAGTSGGAIYVSDNCTLSITSSTVANNTAAVGGGIFVQMSSLTLTASTVSGNTASVAGGGLLDFDDSTAILVNDTFADNSAAEYGGGIAVGGRD